MASSQSQRSQPNQQQSEPQPSTNQRFADLHVFCNSLGFPDESGVYIREPDCAETLRDILRCLRREDDTCDMRRELARLRLLQRDLLPLVKRYADETDVLDRTLRLMVCLTKPALLCFQNQLPDPARRPHYIALLSHLADYKLAFCDVELLRQFTKLIDNFVDRRDAGSDYIGDEEREGLERVLVVLRNVLHAGGVDAAVNCGQDARDDPRICHERLIRCLLDAGLPRALVGLAANSAGCKHYSMHLLEILHLLLRHRNPAALAGGSAAVASASAALERAAKAEARSETRCDNFRYLSTRHGRFGGTYQLTGVTGVAGRPVVFHRDLNQLRDWSCDQDKTRRKVPKNRRLVVDDPRSTGAGGCDFEGGAAPITTSRVTEGLRDLCEALLARAFNPLMRRARQHLDSPSSQVGDETFYLWSVKFFFAYARHRPGGSRRPALHHLTAAFSLDSFGFVHRQIMTCAESANLERGANQAIWSRRLLLALSAYNQMFLVLSAAIALPSNSANKNGPADYETDPDWLAQVEESRALAREVLYLPEYRDAYPELLRSIQDRWAGLDLYREVLEGGFAMMRLMDRWARDGNLVQQRRKSRAKARRRRRQQGNKSAASKRKAAKQQQATVLTEEQRDDLWNSFGDALSQLVSAPPEGVEAEVNEAGLPRLFDPLAPEAEQAASAAGAVQRLLIDGRLAESVVCARRCRLLFPMCGHFDIADDLLLLRAILMDASLVDSAKPDAAEPDADVAVGNEEADDEAPPVNEELLEAQGLVDDEEDLEFEEGRFDSGEYLLRFCHPATVLALTRVLANYRLNAPAVNCSAVRLAHKMITETSAGPMFYQLRTFRVLQTVLKDPDCPDKELPRLCRHIVGQFVAAVKRNPAVFCEPLFLKSLPEARDISDNYAAAIDPKGAAAARRLGEKARWTENLDAELRCLYDLAVQREDVNDIVEFVQSELSDRGRSRRRVMRRMVQLGLGSKAADFRKKPATKAKRAKRPGDNPSSSKARQRRSKATSGQKGATSDDSDSDEADRRAGRDGEEFVPPSGSAAAKSASAPAPPAPRMDEAKLAERLLNARRLQSDRPGVAACLAWLADQLADCLRDRLAGDADEQVLLCLDPAADAALDEEPICAGLLLSAGLQPPALDAASRFWRCPADASAEKLRRVLDLLAAPNADLEALVLANFGRPEFSDSDNGDADENGGDGDSDIDGIGDEDIRNVLRQFADDNNDVSDEFTDAHKAGPCTSLADFRRQRQQQQLRLPPSRREDPLAFDGILNSPPALKSTTTAADRSEFDAYILPAGRTGGAPVAEDSNSCQSVSSSAASAAAGKENVDVDADTQEKRNSKRPRLSSSSSSSSSDDDETDPVVGVGKSARSAAALSTVSPSSAAVKQKRQKLIMSSDSE
ncbi:hypothetical protein BOX15_Mlig001836g2 [Macrostomum lignano]|uniref:Timeless N-terminal domain-containing protein n=1 Tax=Macrostomum lignano TaxID=282301 RepID=A0A267GFL8_9PLAT|nr:hypothetical protein BOX15_Mlig001836g2 [Macrostomum lignano]